MPCAFALWPAEPASPAAKRRRVGNGRDRAYAAHVCASDGALDELISEARKDATLNAARVTRSGGTLTSHGVIVWKPASTASGRDAL